MADQQLSGIDSAPARRVFAAWSELRSGAAIRSLKEGLYGAGGDALDLAQLEALELIVDAGELRMSDVAAGLRVEASTATRTIDRLANEALAERVSAPEDRRGIIVRPTMAGRERLSRIHQEREANMQRILADFDEDELEMLAVVMERLVESITRVARDLAD